MDTDNLPMSYSDWSIHLIAAKKALANAEAAAALHKWKLANAYAMQAQLDCTELEQAFIMLMEPGEVPYFEIPIDNLGGQG